MGTQDVLDAYGIPVIPDPADAAGRKRRSITDAALAEFLAEGYSAASMDAITQRSGVSKATIYKHFGSKERLFLAVVGGVLAQSYADAEPADAALADIGHEAGAGSDSGTGTGTGTGTGRLRVALVRFTTDWARVLLRPDIMALRRLVIGEIDRFPQLGQLWYRVTYDRCNRPLVDALAALHDRGVLDVPDPELAARQLLATTVGVPQLVHTFAPGTEPDEDELARVAGSGVDLFLAGYGRK
ncbi:TetR/AcrR family transcriptional regulator [Streptomyces sp. NPDC127092]|uniref:TetR/AcrR family transcriptional regulator n=1 Tax=Streptomyces sp. NPDC127092 TaxID=3347135 RepID=UPI0036525BBC